MGDRQQLIERERRWALPVAVATMAAVVAIVVANAVGGNALGGEGGAEALRNLDDHTGAFRVAGALTAVGFLLLIAPMAYLFGAAEGRSKTMRRGLIGVVVIAPLFLATASMVGTHSTIDAAADFVGRGITGSGERADDVATDALREASLRDLTTGLSVGGALGFAAALLYSCLHAMRVGLLSRFWGSLGMALGVISIFFLQFLPLIPFIFIAVLVWFIYLGILIAGWVPGGRPRAWAAGEAVPWPAPGASVGATESEADRAESKTSADEAGEGPDGQTPANPPRERGERRKRKRRR